MLSCTSLPSRQSYLSDAQLPPVYWQAERDIVPAKMAAGDWRDDGALSLGYLNNYFGPARARELMVAAGLTDAAGIPLSYVGAVEFWRLCVDNILATNDEAHGITRQPLPKFTWGSIYSAVNQMDTMHEGLRRFAELVAIVPADITVRIGYPSQAIHVHFSMTHDGCSGERTDRYLESVALVFHCIMSWITGEDIAPLEIRTSALMKEEDGSLLACIGSPMVRRGEGISILYDRSFVDLPLGVRKYKAWAVQETEMFHQLIATARARARREDKAETARHLAHLLAERPLTQREAARELCISPATMKRRLAMEGTSFRMVSKAVRSNKLKTLLDAGENLDDIAVTIGLSDRRSLWRSCNDWLGMSPSAYRRQRIPMTAAE